MVVRAKARGGKRHLRAQYGTLHFKYNTKAKNIKQKQKKKETKKRKFSKSYKNGQIGFEDQSSSVSGLSQCQEARALAKASTVAVGKKGLYVES